MTIPVSPSGPIAPTGYVWKLVWSDDFDGSAGADPLGLINGLNRKYWNDGWLASPNTAGQGVSAVQYVSNTNDYNGPAAVVVNPNNDSCVHLKLIDPTDSASSPPGNRPYECGQITTNGLVAINPGGGGTMGSTLDTYVQDGLLLNLIGTLALEVKFKAAGPNNIANGYWGWFGMYNMGDAYGTLAQDFRDEFDNTATGATYTEEIDLAEQLGSSSGQSTGAAFQMHFHAASSVNGGSVYSAGLQNTDVSQDFHTLTTVVDPTGLLYSGYTWGFGQYCDGVQSNQGPNPIQSGANVSSQFTAPQYLLMAMQVNAGTTVTLPTIDMQVDYVAVWQLVPGNPPTGPSITTTSLPSGAVGQGYNAAVSGSGGTQPFSWAVSSGTLPPGVVLVNSTSESAALSGTPSVAGNYTFTLEVTDARALTASYTYTISISAASTPLSISTASLPLGIVGNPYSAQLTASGGASLGGASSVVQSGHADTNSANLSLNLANTVTAGNSLLAFIESAAVPTAAPTGWSLLKSVSLGGGSTAANPGIMVIMMENQDYSTVAGTSYVGGTIMKQYAYLSQLYAAGHYSEPNYVYMVSGNPTAYTNSAVSGDSGVVTSWSGYNSTTIADQISALGHTCKCYAADGTAGHTYHNPFRDVFPGAAITQVLGGGQNYTTGSNTAYNQLITDLNGASPPAFSFVIPTYNDQGDPNASAGDTFLSSFIPAIQATTWYKNGGQIILVWDESASNDNQGPTSPPSNPIFGAIISNYTHANYAGHNYTTELGQAGILRSIENAFGIASYLGDASKASWPGGQMDTLLQQIQPSVSTSNALSVYLYPNAPSIKAGTPQVFTIGGSGSSIPGTWTFVQFASVASTDASDTLSLTLNKATTPGNIMIGVIQVYGQSGIAASEIFGGATSGWSPVIDTNQGGYNYQDVAMYIETCTSPTTVVSGQVIGTTYGAGAFSVSVFEFDPGSGATVTIDAQQSVATTTASTSAPGAAVTPSAAGDLIIQCISTPLYGGPPPGNPSSPWNFVPNGELPFAWQVASGTGPYSAPWNFGSTSTTYSGLSVALKSVVPAASPSGGIIAEVTNLSPTIDVFATKNSTANSNNGTTPSLGPATTSDMAFLFGSLTGVTAPVPTASGWSAVDHTTGSNASLFLMTQGQANGVVIAGESISWTGVGTATAYDILAIALKLPPANAGGPPYTWAITGGALETGLTLSSSGAITGTPTVSGNPTIAFQVTDSGNHTVSKSLVLNVNPPITPTPSPTPTPNQATTYINIGSVLTVTPIGYGGLQVNWTLPTGKWNEMVLLRSSFGTPLSVYAGDGIQLGADQVSGWVYLQSEISQGQTYNTIEVTPTPSPLLPGQTLAFSPNEDVVPNNTQTVVVATGVPQGSTIIPVNTFTAVANVSQASGVWVTSYQDTGLRSGRFYYYGLFVYSTDFEEWILAGAAQGLVLTQYGFSEDFVSWMPDFYLEQDAQLTPANPLERFLQLLGYETDWIRSEMESLFLFSNPELISGALLPYMSANYGIDYEAELGMARSRVLVQNAVYIYKHRGTLEGIQAAASAFSGYSAEVSLGINELIQLDDGASDLSSGHWITQSSDTSIGIVSAASMGLTVPVPPIGNAVAVVADATTPPHMQYDPVPSAITLPVLGYLPANNANVTRITSTAQSLYLTSCTSSTAPTLGIPIPQDGQAREYVFSAYFTVAETATPVAQAFYLQIDWYDRIGASISSTSGVHTMEVLGTWTRVIVIGSPPPGAYSMGLTIQSANPLGGAFHLLDAVQLEVNTQATPGPTFWQPPRDIQITLLPVRQNLVTNPVGRAGMTGWNTTNASAQATYQMASPPIIEWPANVSSGFMVSAEPTISSIKAVGLFGAASPGEGYFGGGEFASGGVSGAPQGNIIFSMPNIPVEEGISYSFSIWAMAALVARNIQLSINFYNDNGSLISLPAFSIALTEPLSQGISYTSIAVSPTPFSIAASEGFTLIGPSTRQLLHSRIQVGQGATSIPVSSFVPNADYPAGTIVNFASTIFAEEVGSFGTEPGAIVNSTAPEGAVSATIQAIVIGPSNQETHYFAAPLFEPLPYVLRYFDANFQPSSDYWWEGTPNESASDYYPNLKSKLSRLITVMPDFVPIGSTFSLGINGDLPSSATRSGTPPSQTQPGGGTTGGTSVGGSSGNVTATFSAGSGTPTVANQNPVTGSGWYHVQDGVISNGSASPLQYTYNNVVKTGSLLVAVINVMYNSTQPSVSTITDNASNVWVKVLSTTAGGYTYQTTEIWACFKANSFANPLTVSINIAGGMFSGGAGAWLAEYSNGSPSLGASVSSAPPATSGTSTAASVTVTPAEAGDLLISAATLAIGNDAADPTSSPGAPWTTVVGPYFYTNITHTLPIAYMVSTDTTTETAVWDQTNSAGWAGIAAAFKIGAASTAPPVFTADNPPTAASVGTAYTYTFAATGNPAPTFMLESGNLPPGMSLNSSGQLSGTPTTAGNYSFAVTASNTAGSSTTPSFTISVAVQGSAPQYTADSPANTATVGTAYSYTFAASGNPTYSVASGTLPPGLALSGTTGVLSGTPTTAGAYTFQISAQNSYGTTDSPNFTITVAAVSSGGGTTGSLPTPSAMTSGKTWSVLFSDDFNGSSLDTSKWNPTWGGNMNTAPTPSSNVAVSGGYLRLSTNGNAGACCTTAFNGFTIDATAGNYYAEARIWFPADSNGNIANWPAWWLTGVSAWPTGGEIDIAEGLGGKLAITYHSGPSANNDSPAHIATPSGSFANSWHTYGVYVTESEMLFFYDQNQVGSLTTSQLPSGAVWTANDPKYVILNNSPNGGSGTYYGGTSMNATMLVDYVYIWRQTS